MNIIITYISKSHALYSLRPFKPHALYSLRPFKPHALYSLRPSGSGRPGCGFNPGSSGSGRQGCGFNPGSAGSVTSVSIYDAAPMVQLRFKSDHNRRQSG